MRTRVRGGILGEGFRGIGNFIKSPTRAAWQGWGLSWCACGDGDD